jgi:hypothetical protein
MFSVGDTVRIVGTRNTIGTVTAVSEPVDDMDTVYQVTIPSWGTFVYYIDALAPLRLAEAQISRCVHPSEW